MRKTSVDGEGPLTCTGFAIVTLITRCFIGDRVACGQRFDRLGEARRAPLSDQGLWFGGLAAGVIVAVVIENVVVLSVVQELTVVVIQIVVQVLVVLAVIVVEDLLFFVPAVRSLGMITGDILAGAIEATLGHVDGDCLGGFGVTRLFQNGFLVYDGNFRMLEQACVALGEISVGGRYERNPFASSGRC